MSTMIQANLPPTVIAAFVQSKCEASLARMIKVFKGVINTLTITNTIIAVITPVKDRFPVMKAIELAIKIPTK